MNDKERFILAEKIRKRIQEKHPHFHLIKRRDEIEKKLKMQEVDCRS
jgi:hypothetical protein